MSKNQFKEDISPSLYQEICDRNLKLLRQLDKLNFSQQNLLSENLKLKNDLNNLNNSLENIETEFNNLEVNFKALNKPLIINLELTNFSLSTISLLLLLFILFISLWKNFLTLNNDNKALKILSQEN